MKKILVTGSSGQLGSELKKITRNKSNYIWIFVDKNSFKLSKVNEIFDKLSYFKPNLIINCAAYNNVNQANNNFSKADLINNIAVKKISDYSKLNLCKLIHFSTDYVFDNSFSSPIKECFKPNPLNKYGISKLNGEINCIKSNEESLIIRTSWSFSSFGNNFVKKIISLIEMNKDIDVVSDQFGSPTYVGDLASAVIKIVENDSWKHGIYNFCNDGEVSRYQLACDIRDILNSNCKINKIKSSDFDFKVQRPKYSVLDNNKIKKAFNLTIPHYIESLNHCIKIIKDDK